MKIKVKSSERIKRRYLLIEGAGKEEIEQAILKYLGVLGFAKAKPVFVNEGGKIILAVERKSLNDIRAAFELCKEDIRIRKVSGTIKGLGIK